MAFFPFGRVIMSSLFKRASKVSYPVKPLAKAGIVRGHVENDIDNCIFCGICAKKCPTGAISAVKTEKSWTISRFQCVLCNCCVEVCQKKCLYMSPELTPASDNMVKDTVNARISDDA